MGTVAHTAKHANDPPELCHMGSTTGQPSSSLWVAGRRASTTARSGQQLLQEIIRSMHLLMASSSDWSHMENKEGSKDNWAHTKPSTSRLPVHQRGLRLLRSSVPGAVLPSPRRATPASQVRTLLPKHHHPRQPLAILSAMNDGSLFLLKVHKKGFAKGWRLVANNICTRWSSAMLTSVFTDQQPSSDPLDSTAVD